MLAAEALSKEEVTVDSSSLDNWSSESRGYFSLLDHLSAVV
jgi:hypothetical protein